MLGAKIASALEKIVTNPYFKEERQSGGAKDVNARPIPPWKTDYFMIYEYFRVTGAHEAVLDYTDLFSTTVQGDDLQDFDTRWCQASLSTGEVPTDNVLESLCKIRIRESVQL